MVTVYRETLTNLAKLAPIVKIKLFYLYKRLHNSIYNLYCVLCRTVFISASISVSSAIRQSLFRQNVVSENSPKFNDVKVSRYTVALCYKTERIERAS